MDNNLEDFNYLLLYLVGDFIKSKGVDYAKKDHLLNEARIAAWKAIGDFKEEKMVKISTFITTCVKNHLTNVSIEISKNDQRSKDAKEAAPDDPYHTRRSGHTLDDLEFLLTMKSLLTPHEFTVFEMRFVQDCSLVEIQKSFDMNRREVEKCLRSILQKYSSLEENLNQTLTQRQHQTKWLEDLPE